jgi:hypothetical protein
MGRASTLTADTGAGCLFRQRLPTGSEMRRGRPARLESGQLSPFDGKATRTALVDATSKSLSGLLVNPYRACSSRARVT